MKEKVLKDIRYYESDIANKAGNPLPSNIGVIYYFSKEIHSIGERIARKLNEYNFISGEFDHIYINYSLILRDSEILISQRRPENWLIYIDYGVSPCKANCLTEYEKTDFIIESTFKSLKHIYKGQEDKLSIIERVEGEVKDSGSNLEIFYKVKETVSYKVVLSYKIKPNGDTSPLIIEYFDFKNNHYFKDKVLDMQFFDDIYPLVDSISVKGGNIILSPKKSYRADLYNKRYKIPLEIQITKYLNM